MFDIGRSELAVIALVAVVVIGPKDLPAAMRTAALWIRKIRSLANEFQSGLNEIVREAELDELKRDIDRATSVDLKNEIGKHLDPTGEAEKALDISSDLKDLDGPPETQTPETQTPETQTPEVTADAAPALPSPETPSGVEPAKEPARADAEAGGEPTAKS